MVFLRLILLLSFTLAGLLGNYQLYNSEGPVLYDFSGSGNHAEVNGLDGSSPILTDRGQYLPAGSRIEFPSNMFKIYPTTASSMIIAMWFVAKTNGLLIRVSKIENNQVTYCLIDWEDNQGQARLVFKGLGRAEWNFVVFEYIQTLSGMQVNFYESLLNPTIVSYTYTGFQLGSSTTSWGIKKALNGDLDGFFYEIWWRDNTGTDLISILNTIQLSKSIFLTTPPQLDPYKTSNNIICSTTCSQNNKSCIGSSTNCYNLCTIGCNYACYNFTTLTCINSNLKYCTDYDTFTNTCSDCMDTFTLSGSSCSCEITEKLLTLNSISKCVTKIDYCIKYDYFNANCVECESLYYLHCSPTPCTNYHCVPDCPTGYYKSIGPAASCNLCSSECLTCTYFNTCSSCHSPKYLKLGSCVDSCGIEYYLDTTQTICNRCPYKCETCSNTDNVLACSKCIIGYYLKNGSCTHDCGIGYYGNDETRLCQICPVNCASCNSEVCTGCMSGYYFKTSNASVLCEICASFISGQCIQSFSADATMETNGTLTLNFSIALNSELTSDLLTFKSDSLTFDNTTFNLATVTLKQIYTISFNKILLSGNNNMRICFPTDTQKVISSNSLALNTEYLDIDLSPAMAILNSCTIQNCSTCSKIGNIFVCDSCLNSNCLYTDIIICGTCCDNGYYQASAQNLCIKCPELCTQCSSEILCSGCVQNAYLSGVCSCNQHYQKINGACIKYMNATAEMIADKLITLRFDKPLLNPLSSGSVTFTIQGLTYESIPMKNIDQDYYFYFNQIHLVDSSEIKLNFIDYLYIKGSDNSYLEESFLVVPVSLEQRCTSYCERCHQVTGISICDRCMIGFILKNDVPGYSCDSACPSNYYIDTSVSPNICEKCDETCSKCSEAGCLECVQGYLLDNSCVNECLLRYYEDTSSMKCLPCEIENCISCNKNEVNDTVICTQCENETVLINAVEDAVCMKCPDGTYYKESECVECIQLCSKCNASSCIECVENASLLEGKCKCSSNTTETSGKCVSYLILSIEALENQVIKLSFNKPLKNDLRSETLSIEINGHLYNSDYFDLSKDSSQVYMIHLKNIEISSSTSLIIELDDDDSIIGIDNSYLPIYTYSVDLVNLQNNPEDQANSDKNDNTSSIFSQANYLAQDPAAQEVASQGSTATSSITTISAAMSFTSTAGLWNLVNTVQLLSVIPLLNVEVPIMLFAGLTSLRSYNPLPNIMIYIMPQTGPRPFRRASLLGFETAQFFINLGDVVFTFLIIIGVLPLLLIIRRFLPDRFKGKLIDKKVTQMIQDYKWNALIRFYIESYIELGIASSLQIFVIKDISDYNDIQTYINIIPAFITIISVIMFPLLLAYFIYKNHIKVGNDEFMKRWGSIFEEFDTSRGLYSVTFYYVHFLIRRLVIIACFFLLKDMPVPQIIIASVFCWIKFYIVARYRPFKERSTNIINILIELSIASSYTLVICFAYDIGETAKEIVQWTIIGFVMLGFATNISSILYNTITFIIYKVKNKKSQNKIHSNPEMEDRYSGSIFNETIIQTSTLQDDNPFYSRLNRRKDKRIL